MTNNPSDILPAQLVPVRVENVKYVQNDDVVLTLPAAIHPITLIVRIERVADWI